MNYHSWVLYAVSVHQVHVPNKFLPLFHGEKSLCRFETGQGGAGDARTRTKVDKGEGVKKDFVRGERFDTTTYGKQSKQKICQKSQTGKYQKKKENNNHYAVQIQ